MKTIIFALLILSINTQAQEKFFSINPERIHIPLFKIYSNGKYFDNHIRLQGLTNDGSDTKSVLIPIKDYVLIKEIAKPTLKVSSVVGNGSAVHVGGRLVLTNLHVISSSKKRIPNKCKASFYSKAYSKKEVKFKCKKIHYCSSKMDYCLIELYNSKRGVDLLNHKSAVLIEDFHPIDNDKTELISVGNTMGLGIHGSSGFGFHHYDTNNFKFYAGVFTGNSGGGVFNKKGELVGLVRAQSKTLFSTDSFNVAIPLGSIKRDLESQSNIDFKILSQLTWKAI